jgi:hypothetical protein
VMSLITARCMSLSAVELGDLRTFRDMARAITAQRDK